jgi:hypothetical protein
MCKEWNECVEADGSRIAIIYYSVVPIINIYMSLSIVTISSHVLLIYKSHYH